MAEGDRTAVDVHALGIEAQLVDARQCLGREGLVQLHEIDLVHRPAEAGERLPRGRDGADAHPLGLDPRHRSSHDPCHRLQTRVPSVPLGDDEEGRRTVVDARRVSGRDRPVLPEDGTQAGERLRGRVRPRMLVDRYDHGVAVAPTHPHRHDLVVEAARRDGAGRTLLAFRGEGVLRIAGDTVFVGDDLGGLPETDRPLVRKGRVGEAPAQDGVGRLRVTPSVRRRGLEHDVWSPAHALDPTCHEGVAFIGGDRVVRREHRLHPRAT